ncbi:MAG: FAD-binding oxidoreductase [Deltaproteobacteria bacterium]|nr:FAD-binding oxidoreductase [Deltaproteobacteria bacterium]MBW2069871.1 FAD-binding oxidoreductase [Deltaproteobacteria bacterium]
MAPEAFDIVIVGGGIMGCAVAFSLLSMDDTLQVAVIEKDLTYSRASTTLSLANVRVQFSLKENIQISKYTLEVLERFGDLMAVNDHKPEISFHREGNLFLVDDAGREAAQEALRLQRHLGCRVEWWTPKEIEEHYPLYQPKEMAGGTFGHDDGHFDAYAMLMAYRAKARSLGAKYIEAEVDTVLVRHKQVIGVSLHTGENLHASVVINCAGAWAAGVAQTAGVNLPVAPVKRQVFVVDTAVKPEGALPLTLLPTGLYFRTELGGTILLGKSMAEDPTGFDFSWDDKRFTDLLWPELAEFVPAFDTLKLLRGWAGLYAVNTLDGNAILGEWPELKGFYLANGFSGHGLQQAPAVGRYLAECILERPLSLDLSIFAPDRILDNRPISERGIV